MDINFHYFAIKSLAFRAGFSEEEAQTLAEFSQLTDDYNRYDPVHMTDVPEFARHLAKKSGDHWLFYCATTGFGYFDLLFFLRKKRQKRILIPFHFIPPQPLNAPFGENDAAWRTKPETLQKDTLLRGLLQKAQARYQTAPRARASLIHLGLVLHTFADTYAHQQFSGYEGWWNDGYARNWCWNKGTVGCSCGEVREEMEPLTTEGDTCVIPAIAHARFFTLPDKSARRFTAMQKASPDSALTKYERDNTEIFLHASRVIFDYLRACRGLAPVADSEWRPVCEAMRKGLLTRETKKISRLATHWKKYFPEIGYHYSVGEVYRRSLWVERQEGGAAGGRGGGKDGAPDDAARVEENILEHLFSPLSRNATAASSPQADVPPDVVVTPVGDDFFWLNVFAKEMRDEVNGEVTPLE